MASVDDKGCYNPSTKSYNLDSHTIMKSSSNSRKALSLRAKPTPSKWDDAQKWLMGLSDHKHNSTSKPRNSNAEDRRLLAPMPSKGRDSCGSIDDALPIQHQEEETKKIDVSNKSLEEVAVEMRSVSLRDMGTEMTPTASKEPSRTGTPLRARSPVNSRHSSPREPCSSRAAVSDSKGVDGKLSSLESRALAWDEAEKAKYMARRRWRAGDSLSPATASTPNSRPNAEVGALERKGRHRQTQGCVRTQSWVEALARGARARTQSSGGRCRR